MSARLGVRWTIGDVSAPGFEALRLSILGMWRLFGRQARYAVCVNQIPASLARRRAGPLPAPVEWLEVGLADLPAPLRARFDAKLAEGTGWKLAPVRLFPRLHELSLDNDCILWAAPAPLREWLEGRAGLIAEDVRAGFGRFGPLCGPHPRNSGIRGLPPGFDYTAALLALLRDHPALLECELDEQGLQTATLERFLSPRVVPVREVTICSPFWPHLPHLGRCGAHFIGLNARHLPWSYYDRPADDWMADHWQKHRPELSRRVGAASSAPDFPGG